MKCSECNWLVKGVCTIQKRPRQSDLRKCNIAIIKRLAPQMRGNVLEIGYGKMITLKRNLRRRSAIWYGVEPRWGVDEKASRKFNGKASDIPFENGFFDVVCAYQTMEHWREFGDSVESGLTEIARVLKPGGLFSATVPIQNHGDKMFLHGDIDMIRSLFHEHFWSKVEFEDWHRNCEPMPAVIPTQRQIKRIKKMVNCAEVTSWILEIRAVRNQTLAPVKDIATSGTK